MEVQPPPPSLDAALGLTWKVSGYNVRDGKEEPTFDKGSWQYAMIERWPSISRAEWVSKSK